MSKFSKHDIEFLEALKKAGLPDPLCESVNKIRKIIFENELKEESNMDHILRCRQATIDMRDAIGDYFKTTCRTRSASEHIGSYYPDQKTGEEVDKFVFNEKNEAIPYIYDTNDITPECTAYTIKGIGGKMGVVPIESVRDGAVIKFVDPKGTGFFSACVKDEDVNADDVYTDNTTVVLGYEQGVEIIFTFHPGRAVLPSRRSMSDIGDKMELSKEEAIDLGIKYVKIGNC